MAKTQNGRWAFLLGMAVAIVGVFVPQLGRWEGILLLICGLMVGAINVSSKDTTTFVVAVLGIGLGSVAIGSIDILGSQISIWVMEFVLNIIAFAGAAVLVVAAKTAYSIAKE